VLSSGLQRNLEPTDLSLTEAEVTSVLSLCVWLSYSNSECVPASGRIFWGFSLIFCMFVLPLHAKVGRHEQVSVSQDSCEAEQQNPHSNSRAI